jgi:hypothetical protein
MAALRICLDRILPLRKDRSIEFAMPAITGVEDAPKAMAAITAAVAQGEITPPKSPMFPAWTGRMRLCRWSGDAQNIEADSLELFLVEF